MGENAISVIGSTAAVCEWGETIRTYPYWYSRRPHRHAQLGYLT